MFAMAAIIKYHRPDGLNNRNVFAHSSEAYKSKIKMSAGWFPYKETPAGAEKHTGVGRGISGGSNSASHLGGQLTNCTADYSKIDRRRIRGKKEVGEEAAQGRGAPQGE